MSQLRGVLDRMKHNTDCVLDLVQREHHLAPILIDEVLDRPSNRNPHQT